MKTMFIEWPDFGVKVEAVLEDERNPELIKDIWDALPMESIQEHAMVTGKSMYAWVPIVSFAPVHFEMRIKDTPPGVVSFSQKTGNKMIVRYGKVTEDLLTPIVGFIDQKYVPEIDRVGQAVYDNYYGEKKPFVVKYSKGRDE